MIGYWTEQGQRLTPSGEVSLVGRAGRAYSIMKGGKKVGALRRAGTGAPKSGWFVQIDGFRFYTLPGQGAARFGVKETHVKHYPDAPTARKAIDAAFQLLGAQ